MRRAMPTSRRVHPGARISGGGPVRLGCIRTRRALVAVAASPHATSVPTASVLYRVPKFANARRLHASAAKAQTASPGHTIHEANRGHLARRCANPAHRAPIANPNPSPSPMLPTSARNESPAPARAMSDAAATVAVRPAAVSPRASLLAKVVQSSGREKPRKLMR